MTKCAASFYNARIYIDENGGETEKTCQRRPFPKEGRNRAVGVSGTPEGSVLIFLVVPLDHADADCQQHGGNDGCGEDKAVLKRKQEPVGQHLAPRVQQWSSSKHRRAFTCFLLRDHRNSRETNGVHRRSCSRASYPD